MSANFFTLLLLGAFEVRSPSQAIIRISGRKTRAIGAYLAARQCEQSRHTLMDLFCQGAKNPAAALRWQLSRLRSQLHKDLIQTTRKTVTFDGALGWVDCVAFAKLLEGDLEQVSQERLLKTVKLYRGEFLQGLWLADAPEFEFWLLGQRARFAELYQRGLSEIIKRFIAQEQYQEAIPWALHLVQSDLLHEEGHLRLIWLYAQTGQREMALAQYSQYVTLLREELGIEATPALEALREQILVEPVTSLATPSLILYEREAELRHLHQLWLGACNNQGAVVLLEAEAGGGKTCLVQTFAQHIPNALILRARCYESATALPYHPWFDILEAYLDQIEPATYQQMAPFWAEYLARFLPEFARRAGQKVLAPPPTSGSQVQQLFMAIANFLFAAKKPLLMFVDDLQWADQASLHLFHFLARRSPSAALLLIGAFRPEDVTQKPPWQSWLADLQRDPHHLMHLKPLTLAAMTELVSKHCPTLPVGKRSDVCEMLASATAGNPFFVTELLGDIADRKEVPETLPLPTSVRDLIDHRLRQLPASTQQLLQALAIFGEPSTFRQVRQLSTGSEQETVMALEVGLQRGLLQTLPDSYPTRYDFRHDLVREAVIRLLSEARRRFLHRRTVTVLLQNTSRLKPSRRLEVAGRITQHALVAEAFALIKTWAPLAAERARQLHAYADALIAYEAASLAVEQLLISGELADATAQTQQIEFLLHRAELIYGVSKRALTEGEALLQAARNLLSQHPAPPPELEARFYYCQALFHDFRSQYDKAHKAALNAYHYYIKLGDEKGASEALFRAGISKMVIGQNKAARELISQALAKSRKRGEIHGQLPCLSGLAWCACSLGEIEVALGYLRQSLEMARKRGDKYGEALTTYSLANTWNYYYQAEKVQSFAQQAEQLYQGIGGQMQATRLLYFFGEACRAVGDWQQAQTFYQKALATAESIQNRWIEGWASQQLGRLALRAGDLSTASARLQRANECRQASGEVHNQLSDLAWLARLHLAQEQPQQALAQTTEMITRLDALWGEFYVWEMPDVMMSHAEALAANKHHPEALKMVQPAYLTLIRFTEQMPSPQLKQHFLAFYLNARIINAWQTGQIKAWPLL